MTTLILDTSTRKSFVAVSCGAKLLSFQFLPEGRLTSKFLFTAIEDELKKNQVSISDLQRVAAGVGPGSFTGIRVGQASAQGISFGLNIPLVGFSSLVCYVSQDDGEFISALETKKGQLCYIRQQREGGVVMQLSDPIYASLVQLTSSRIPCFGPHSIAAFCQEIEPDFVFLATYVDSLYQAGNFTRDGQVPLIYHPS